ncbi:NADPH-dependent FMN reductase [Kribbella solani]|uniref:NAD(P)H-dependent FMN reductase n=1 Tax=Kribbella solani TaxID=236067 RepID=A0A841DK90_9ACTN|nr:NAD(P)H-dependent oxidoreductase [Kribbella solani]MBB5977196.1 NAD(P)H-dependent FMN reductase [Kribbella solani]MDX2973736.1 NAD(P)H-dependent oxidoreductase [Kribbella solani]MDX3002109.1 NAD(P)H-dependent oxidoreductase [Kribbella solani]
MMRLAVIIGSTRRGRFGPTVAHWLAHQAAKQFDVDLVDLATAGLPATLPDTDDEVPRSVELLAPRLAAADAFAVVTPEINSSFPAALKTALDWYYEEWHAKPVAIISYGREGGGCLATAQLRQIFTELQAVTIRNTVTLPCYWEQFTADGGWPKPSAGYEAEAKVMLDQLVWWAAALQDARTRRPYRP